jgi:DUF4097 and DUF4098 domain-containing protein YvlB
MRKVVLCLFFALGMLASVSLVATAQDFQQSYPAAAGASVNIKSVSGNITITGSSGGQITVSGFKEGTDRDMVSVEDLSSGNTINVSSKYPRNCQCNASINFQVSVPQGVSLNFDNISTASGNVSIQNVTGRVNAKSASGDVTVQEASGHISASSASGNVTVTGVAGSVSARAASGNVEAHLSSISGSDNMEFASASGDVRVWVPDGLDADVNMSTSSGSLDTDFALQVDQHNYGPGKSAHGRLGSGARTLRLSTASGNVSLKRVSS